MSIKELKKTNFIWTYVKLFFFTQPFANQLTETRVTKNSYKALNLSKKLACFEVGSEYAISPKKNAISDFTV